MTEWRQIPSHPDYAVSSEGRIKRTSPTQYGCGYEINPCIQEMGSGYKRAYVGLRDAGSTRSLTRLLHQLVCEAFHGPRPSAKHGVRHLDGNPLNNSASNLCWGTQAENAADTRRHGTGAWGERNGQAKLTETDVAAIRSRVANGEMQMVVAADYCISSGHVSQIVNRKIWVGAVAKRRASMLRHTRPEARANT